MNKKDLRNLYLQKRKDLHPEEQESFSRSILNIFSGIDFTTIKYVHIFYPIIGKHEFNSLLLADWLRLHRPEISLVLPKSNFEDHTLSNVLWDEDTPLAMNRWGITEPQHGKEVPSELIDLVVVPLLAFDKKGHRLGYGKGFYDRFLSGCRSNVKKIGISYFEPEELFEDINEYDVPLTSCITPDKLWEFTA